MFRVSDLIDLPIKTLNQDKTFKFSVKSVLLNGMENRVAAFICKEGTLKKMFHIIDYNKIISIDTNGVIIADLQCIQKIHAKELNNYMQMEQVIKKLVKNRTGELYGIVTDIYINLLNGKIVAYEMSEGYIDDLITGRKVVDANQIPDNLLVNKEIIIEPWRNKYDIT